MCTFVCLVPGDLPHVQLLAVCNVHSIPFHFSPISSPSVLTQAAPPLDVLCLLLRKPEDQVVVVFNKPVTVSSTHTEHVYVGPCAQQLNQVQCVSTEHTH